MKLGPKGQLQTVFHQDMGEGLSVNALYLVKLCLQRIWIHTREVDYSTGIHKFL